MRPGMPLRIDRFEVTGELGRGAMGVVYRARDPELEREVAIKVLNSATAPVELNEGDTVDLRSSGELGGRALSEARAMARLSHPNVLPIFEVGREGASMFLVTELVDGSTMTEYLGERPRSVAEIAGVFVLAARGLAAAHARGIVHRDFKPDNVMIGRDGSVRVCDFGVAALSRPDGGALTRVQEIQGTPRFMPPEVWAGATPTVAADVFALCRSAADAFDPPGPAAPPALADLIARGLSDAPADRPALPALIAAFDEAGRAPPPPTNRRKLVVLAAASLLAVAGVTWKLVTSPRMTCDGEVARTRAGYTDELRASLPIAARPGFDRRARALDGADRARCTAADTSSYRDEIRRACIERRTRELVADLGRERALAASSAARAETGLTVAGSAAWSLRDAAACTTTNAPPAVASQALYDAFAQLETLADVTAAALVIGGAAEAVGDRELAGWAFARAGYEYRRRSEFDRSEQLLQRAFAVANEIHDENLAAYVLGERSRTAMFRGDPVAGREVAHLALAYVDHPELAPLTRIRVLYAAGMVEKVQSHIPAAHEHLRRGLATFAIEGVIAPGMEVSLLTGESDALLVREDQREAAEATARAAVSLARATLTTRHPVSASASAALATVLALQDDPVGAAELHRENLERARAAAQGVDANVIQAAVDYSGDLVEMGQARQAVELLAELRPACEQRPQLRWSCSDLYWSLGSAQFTAGAFGEAIATLDRAVAEVTAVHGSDKLETLGVREHHLSVLIELGRLDEAQRELTELVVAYRAHGHEDRARFAEAVQGADIALARGDGRAAAKLAVLGIEKAAPGSRLERFLQIRLAWARVLQGRAADALAPLDRATALAGNIAEDRALISAVRARAELALGRRERARALARSTVEVLDQYRRNGRARKLVAGLVD